MKLSKLSKKDKMNFAGIFSILIAILFSVPLGFIPPSLEDDFGIESYATPSSIGETQPFEFYIEFRHSCMKEVNLTTINGDSIKQIPLSNTENEKNWTTQNEYGMFESNNSYICCYTMKHASGRVYYTSNFTLQVKDTKANITIKCSDYEYETVGHNLEFEINHPYLGEIINYCVYIDNNLIDSGEYNGKTSMDISGYSIGNHNVSIKATDSYGINTTKTKSFKVFKTPIFIESPSDKNYFKEVGIFNLTWKLEDNNLDNYTIYRNNSIKEEGIFSNPLTPEIVFTGNTSSLEVGHYRYRIIVRDEEGRINQDIVDISIMKYRIPTFLSSASPSLINDTDSFSFFALLNDSYTNILSVNFIANGNNTGVEMFELSDSNNDDNWTLSYEYGMLYPQFSNYTCYYEIRDPCGTYNSSSFTLKVNATQLGIHILECEDYEYGTEENFLRFDISHSHPNMSWTYIDGVLIESKEYNGEPIELNISGYNINLHNVTIIANDELGINYTKTDNFRVYKTPKIISSPSNRSYIEYYGNFSLDWEIEDNGLKNYTLLKNKSMIISEDFDTSLRSNLSFIVDTANLSIGLHNYTLIVRDNETIKIQDDVLIEITPYMHPIIDILSPNQKITTTSIKEIKVNISSLDNISIENASWNLSMDSEVLKSLNLTQENATKWVSEFNPTLYEYGNYTLEITCEDQYKITNTSIQLNLEILLSYNINSKNISYNNNNITISALGSNDFVFANTTIIHNSTIKERDFEIRLPSEFADANYYSVSRNSQVFYPQNKAELPSSYTKWHFDDYNSADQLSFKLNKPNIHNKALEKKGDTYMMSFNITSEHSFSNASVINEMKVTLNPNLYNLILETYKNGEWIKYDGIKVLSSDTYLSFKFEISSIDPNKDLQFRLRCVEKQYTMPFPNLLALIGACAFVGGAFFVIAIYEANKRRNR